MPRFISAMILILFHLYEAGEQEKQASEPQTKENKQTTTKIHLLRACFSIEIEQSR